MPSVEYGDRAFSQRIWPDLSCNLKKKEKKMFFFYCQQNMNNKRNKYF